MADQAHEEYWVLSYTRPDSEPVSSHEHRWYIDEWTPEAIDFSCLFCASRIFARRMTVEDLKVYLEAQYPVQQEPANANHQDGGEQTDTGESSLSGGAFGTAGAEYLRPVARRSRKSKHPRRARRDASESSVKPTGGE